MFARPYEKVRSLEAGFDALSASSATSAAGATAGSAAAGSSGAAWSSSEALQDSIRSTMSSLVDRRSAVGPGRKR